MSENILMDPGKSLQRYLELEVAIRKFFDEVAPDFCRNSVNEGRCYPRFCCSKTGLENRSYNEAYEELNESRLEIYGSGNDERTCLYLSGEGCRLYTHKPLICISYACEPLIAALKDKGIEYDYRRIEHILRGILCDKNPLDDAGSFKFGISDEEFLVIKKKLEGSLRPRINRLNTI